MRLRGITLALGVMLAATAGAQAQHGHDHGAAKPAPAAGARQPLRVTMEQLHSGPGGVPAGWRFWWPDGDAKKGKETFAKLECYQCHEIPGEGFPAVTPDPKHTGSALAGMGDQHPAEYFAEAILNPNAVILTGPGFTGPDGLSIMPDFRDSLTLAETVDLVAYIRSLTGGHAHHADHAAAPAELEKTVGSYRIRLAYMAPGGGGHDHDHGGGHQHGAAAAPKAGHVMVFVTDTTTGEPVPYLPVTVTVRDDKAQPRVVKLTPMVGGKGFHYGADLTLPAATKSLTVSVGKPAMKVMASAAGRFAQGAEAAFEWGK